MELTPYQRDILIRTALGEARGEGQEGMADVIQVVLNRANSGKYPSDPAAVALQPSQFSTWNSGAGGNNPQQFSQNSATYKKAAQALDAVVGGRPDPTGGALFYHTPSVNPSWARSANTNGTIQRNGHVFYPTHPVPPGEIPSVATFLDTRRGAPTPAIQSQGVSARRANTSPTGGNTGLQSALGNMAQARARQVTPAMPSMGIQAARNGMFAQPVTNTSRPVGLGDSLGMSPIQGGSQRPPMFNAGYDERTGAMRLVNTPMDTQGMWTARSPAPAPVPASVEDRVTARNRVPPISQASLYAGGGPTRPQATPRVAPIPASVEDRVTARNRPTTGIGMPPATISVPSVRIPVPTPVSARPTMTANANINQAMNEQASMRPRPPASPLAPVAQPAGSFNPYKDQSQLAANAPGVGGFNTPLIPYPASNRPTLNRPAVLTAAGGPPIPMPANMRPTAVGTALYVTPPRVAPIPFARPDFGMGGPVLQNPRVQGFAPVPRTRPLALQAPVARPPLSILVDGSNTIRRPPQFTGGTSSILSLAGGAEDRGYGAYSR